jgi:hypothetical protein
MYGPFNCEFIPNSIVSGNNCRNVAVRRSASPSNIVSGNACGNVAVKVPVGRRAPPVAPPIDRPIAKEESPAAAAAAAENQRPQVRGEWDHRKTYVFGDIVTFAGGRFMSISGDNRANDPAASPARWALLVDDAASAPYKARPPPAHDGATGEPSRGPTGVSLYGAVALGMSSEHILSPVPAPPGGPGGPAAAAANARLDGKEDAKLPRLAAGCAGVPLPAQEGGEPTADESRQCVVCLTNRYCTTVLECGHSSLCVPCARAIVLKGNGLCPTCGIAITRVIRTY